MKAPFGGVGRVRCEDRADCKHPLYRLCNFQTHEKKTYSRSVRGYTNFGINSNALQPIPLY